MAMLNDQRVYQIERQKTARRYAGFCMPKKMSEDIPALMSEKLSGDMPDSIREKMLEKNA